MKIVHNPIEFQGLWTLMERHLHILQFRKCKILSGDNQRVGDIDLGEWTEESVMFAFNVRDVGQVKLTSLSCGFIYRVTMRRGSAQLSGAYIFN